MTDTHLDHLRIGVLLPDLRAGGAERLHINLADEWMRFGISTEFILLSAVGELLDHLPASAKVVDLRAARVRNVLWPLVKYLKESKPDAIIAAMWPLTVFAPLAARLAGYQGRVIISEHSPLSIAYGSHSLLHRLIMRASQHICYPLAHVRIGVSSGIASDLAKLSRLKLEKFTVIHNPAALGKADSKRMRPEELVGRKGPIILNVATLKPVKRHDVLIDAFARLPDKLQATLCILGEGQMRAELELQIERLGLHGKIILPGFAADPGPWYAHSDVFVLSSDYEGFGNVLVEAMEYGLAVVSTDCPVGPREILADGRYGKLVPVGDPEGLSQAIACAIEDTPDQSSLKLRTLDFSLGPIAKKYIDTIFP